LQLLLFTFLLFGFEPILWFSGIVEGKVALDNNLFNYHYTRLFLKVGL